LKPTKFHFVGLVLFSQKRMLLQFQFYLDGLIEHQAFHAKKLKDRPIIIIMRPSASLTGC
jgi:hypothetical protein